MFAWLKSWFSKKEFGTYTDKERMVFSYFNGEKKILADPLELYRRILDKGVDIELDIKLATSESKDAEKARLNLNNTFRKIFELKQRQGVSVEGTLSDLEAEALYDRFMQYCDDVKKNSKRLLMSLEEKESNISLPVVSPMNNSSESGCTVAGGASTVPLT